MKPFTSDLKNKINSYIKNKIDISELIKDVDLKGVDLAGAIIKDFQFLERDISGSTWANTKLGNDKTPCSFIRCNLTNCNFYGARFVGKTWVRSCKAHNCNFKTADLAKVDYQYTDFTASDFCDSILKIGTREGLGCILPDSLFEDLCKGWKMRIKIERTE